MNAIATLTATTVDAPMGTLRLVASERGLRAVLWPNDEPNRVRLGEVEEGTNDVLELAARQLEEYFAGERMTFEVPYDLVGTDFQVRVWQGLADVPYGRTTTYGEQATHLGNPKAVRAVAAANGKNPVSILLPCHRIVGADGTLTGFAGGLEWKAFLLDLERATLGLEPQWTDDGPGENTLF